MATFNDLEIDKFYLVRVNDNSAVSMVQVALSTNQCVLVYEFGEVDITYWKKKSDFIAEIIEELSEEMVDEYETLLMEDFDEFDDEEEDVDDIEEAQEDSKSDKKNKKKKKK